MHTGLIGQGAVSFVDYDDVRHFHDSLFHGLQFITGCGRQHQQDAVAILVDFDLCQANGRGAYLSCTELA
eukprot:SAG31_NODE_46535_length_254_cov_0.664516_1_plen_69_part_10